ncbi:MAG: hypothetical protein LBQ50_02630 [Planctomycetaceae bacterium]|jgi:ubiquitin-protein ligase|nr:hypothetical protein [Planctomycetaceae bacterium]
MQESEGNNGEIMATPQEIRLTRLENDFKQMSRLQGNIISWKPLRGIAPFIEAYEITINVRTIIGVSGSNSPQYRNSSVVILTIPSDYPKSPPVVVMQTQPKPFHPNWFGNGRWCFGTWIPSEGLGDYVVRMVKTLQYDTEITNENSPADSVAKDWYVQNIRSSLFPCDTQTLPDPTSALKIKRQGGQTPPSGGFRVTKR